MLYDRQPVLRSRLFGTQILFQLTYLIMSLNQDSYEYYNSLNEYGKKRARIEMEAKKLKQVL